MTTTASYLPEMHNFEFWRGDDWIVPLFFKVKGSDPVEPINVTSWTFAAQIRRYPTAPDALATWTFDRTGEAVGRIDMILGEVVTATMPPQELAWDLQRILGGKKRTLAAGFVTSPADSTRP